MFPLQWSTLVVIILPFIFFFTASAWDIISPIRTTSTPLVCFPMPIINQLVPLTDFCCCVTFPFNLLHTQLTFVPPLHHIRNFSTFPCNAVDILRCYSLSVSLSFSKLLQPPRDMCGTRYILLTEPAGWLCVPPMGDTLAAVVNWPSFILCLFAFPLTRLAGSDGCRVA